MIVNADDFGLRVAITDAVIRCFDGMGISSATAMVFMADTERAADLAKSRHLPVGLHLNLTYPFDSERVAGDVRERQRAAVEYFARRPHRWWWDPRARTLVADCIRDQLAEFERVFGAAPDHVDGHQHIQTCPTVSMSPALPAGARVRPGHTGHYGRHGRAAAAVRRVRDLPLRHRFLTPQAFYDFRQLHRTWGGPGFDRVFETAGAVEVMTHPGRPDEESLLLDSAWQELLSRHRVGSYAQLR